MEDRSIYLKRLDMQIRRLGRHVAHDSKSLRFLAPRRDPRTLTSVRHEFQIPVIDQLNEGSCTGHAITANMCSGKFWNTVSTIVPRDAQGAHLWARQVYCDATAIDNWPGTFEPDDTGSDGLSVAKVMKNRGLISGYTHATSLEAVLTALATQVVIVGTSWYANMFDVDQTGHINVSGQTIGGHEYALDQLDVENRRVWKRGSWSEYWGQAGRAWMTWDELDRLLHDDGDCTVLVPRAEPAPIPTPEPTPKPTPAPTPPPVDRPSEHDLLLADAMGQYLRTRSVPKYVRNAAEPWLKEQR